MSDQDDASGTIIRGADGTVYFLRDEVLEACKVTEQDALPIMNELLDKTDDVQGFALSSGAVLRLASYSGPFGRSRGGLVAYTSMCAGTMSLRPTDFRARLTSFR